jgi:hypothetical protein
LPTLRHWRIVTVVNLMGLNVRMLLVPLLGIGILYAWLAGNWLGRVLAFMGLTATLAVLGLIYAEGHKMDPTAFTLLSIPAGWFLSGVPLYVRRAKARADWAVVPNAAPSVYSVSLLPASER